MSCHTGEIVGNLEKNIYERSSDPLGHKRSLKTKFSAEAFKLVYERQIMIVIMNAQRKYKKVGIL